MQYLKSVKSMILEKIENEVQVVSQNNFIFSDDHFIATVGVSDLIIVAKGKKILILKKGFSQKVKDFK